MVDRQRDGGRLDQGGSKAITLGYLTAGLLPGVHTKSVVVADPMALNSPATIAVQVTVRPPPFAPVDFDHDGDVDLEDFGQFQICYTGHGIPQEELSCLGARLDTDSDVDQADFDIFLHRCLSGPERPADPICNL